jgi:hypothetical protein
LAFRLPSAVRRLPSAVCHHILSGAEIPSTPNPFAITIRADFASTSLAFMMCSGSPST